MKPSQVSQQPGGTSTLLRFLAHCKPHRRYIGGAALAGIGKFCLPMLFPFVLKYVVDVLLMPHQRPESVNLFIDRIALGLAGLLGLGAGAIAKLTALTAAIFAIYLIQALAAYLRNYWAGIAQHRLTLDLRQALYAHMQQLSHSFFDRNPAGAITARLIHDVDVAREFVGAALTDIWIDGTSLGIVLGALFLLDKRLALIAIGVIPLYVALLRYFAPRIKASSHRLQALVEVFSGEVHERVAGMTTIKAFGREHLEERRFADSNHRLFEAEEDKLRLTARQQMMGEWLTRMAPMVVLYGAAVMIIDGSTSVGTAIAFINLLGFLYVPLERFCQLAGVVSSSLAAIERIFGFLDLKPEVHDHALSRPFSIRQGAITLEHVSFGYRRGLGEPDREVLSDINLQIPGGSSVALVGRSGAGKTTLASLIPRFYDPTQGRVLIDGRNLRHFTLKSLRDNVGIVAQDALLFSATIRENLQLGRPEADERALWEALEQACLLDFVRHLPRGLDTIIGERGAKVSGGQRQRLALARAFLNDPKILILDEATSALDSEAENQVHEVLNRLMLGRTTIIIAHRLRAATEADMVVVLDAGRIVEVGSHDRLKAMDGTYARLFDQQQRSLNDSAALRSLAR